MTRTIPCALGLTMLLAAGIAAAEEERVVVTPKAATPILDLRAGLGAMVSPTLFGLTGSVELRVDKFFSFGPMVQFGLGDDEQISVPSLAGRFIVPLTFKAKPEDGRPDLELSLHTGFGVMFRSEGTFDFQDFAYHAGFNADYFAIRELTVGLGATWTIVSSSVERSTGLLYASAGYHF